MSDQETARPAIPTSERLQVAREGAERARARLEAQKRAPLIAEAEDFLHGRGYGPTWGEFSNAAEQIVKRLRDALEAAPL